MIPKILHIAIWISLLHTFNQVYAQTYPIPDNNFRQCLIDWDPALVNSENQLVVSVAASKTGTLNCSGYNIASADGLQFFSALSKLDLSRNKLVEIESLAALNQLVEINVNDNEITSFPSLGSFNTLRVLTAYNNFLSEIPELPVESKLEQLNFGQNNLTFFPDLSGQKNLIYINFARNNNIRTIPPLPDLPAVKEFVCYICGLREVPDISKLPALEVLNIGYNSLTYLPDFSANQNLNTIYANDNRLSSFASMKGLPNLIKARLYNNYLSYEDFMPLLSVADYSEIYKIVPQNTFPNPLGVFYFEHDSISFATGIARNTEGVNYTWFFNDQPVSVSSADDFNIPEANFTHSGSYYFTLQHPLFPDLPINSEVKTITIGKCMDEKAFGYTVKGADCKEPGTITITPGAQPRHDFTYILESNLTGIQTSSANGQFSQLNNPSYRLYIRAGKKCTKLVEEEIILPVEECKEAFFSPNNDGVDDNYYFPQKGKAKIYNKWGQLVKELEVPSEWDGRLQNNKIIPVGYYTIIINEGEEKFHLTVIY